MKIDLVSGAVLEITPMPFEKAWEVMQVVIKEIEGINLGDLGFLFSKFDPSELFKLKGPLCALLSNKKMVEAAKLCFPKCTINGLKIDDSTFDIPSLRSDYISIIFYVLTVNISPFFKNLGSFLTNISNQMETKNSQK